MPAHANAAPDAPFRMQDPLEGLPPELRAHIAGYLTWGDRARLFAAGSRVLDEARPPPPSASACCECGVKRATMWHMVESVVVKRGRGHRQYERSGRKWTVCDECSRRPGGFRQVLNDEGVHRECNAKGLKWYVATKIISDGPQLRLDEVEDDPNKKDWWRSKHRYVYAARAKQSVLEATARIAKA